MTNYILSCCSTCDLTKEILDELDIKYIYSHFSISGEEFLDDFGKSISHDDFYKRMADGEITKTSQITMNEFVKTFEKYLKEGKDVLHVTLSSGLSGIYNSALVAKKQLEEKYPDRKIYIVDSLGASSGYGLLMYKLGLKRKEGCSIEELYKYAEEIKLNIQHWFFSTDLKYYVRGGRISKASGFFGTLLRLCPVLNVNEEGKLIPREKIVSVTLAQMQLVKKIETLAKDRLKYDGDVFISNSGCIKYAEALKKMIINKFPQLKDKIKIFPIGTTIGSHTGPGTIALFFEGDKREAKGGK